MTHQWPRPLIPLKLNGRDVQATAAFPLNGRWHFRWDKLHGNPSPKREDIIEHEGREFKIVSGKATTWHDYVFVSAVPVDEEYQQAEINVVATECRTVEGAAA